MLEWAQRPTLILILGLPHQTCIRNADRAYVSLWLEPLFSCMTTLTPYCRTKCGVYRAVKVNAEQILFFTIRSLWNSYIVCHIIRLKSSHYSRFYVLATLKCIIQAWKVRHPQPILRSVATPCVSYHIDITSFLKAWSNNVFTGRVRYWIPSWKRSFALVVKYLPRNRVQR